MNVKLDILAFGAHPDDVELGCGGTIAKEISRGKKIGIIDLTRGELGTRGTPEIRDEEAKVAARLLGLTTRVNLGFLDGFFQNDKISQMKVIEKIRTYRPDIVLCNAIDDRHLDHPKGSQLVSDACFLSGLQKIKTRSGRGELQKPWRPHNVYHYIQWKNIEPDFVVDISDFIALKLEAVRAYQSQFFDAKSKEPETPISNKNFLDSIRYRAADLGRLTGCKFAEGYTVERYPIVESIFSLK